MTGISTTLIIEPSFALYSNTWIVPGLLVVDRDVDLRAEVPAAAGAARRHRERLGDDSPLASSTRMFTVASKTSALPVTVMGLWTHMPALGERRPRSAESGAAGTANPGSPSNGTPSAVRQSGASVCASARSY